MIVAVVARTVRTLESFLDFTRDSDTGRAGRSVALSGSLSLLADFGFIFR